MKNGQKYAKEINRMVNQEFFECSLWSIRNGKKASEYCCPVPESFDPANGPASGSDEFCKKCLCESLEWLNQEYKDPKDILTDKEKEIVKSMIDFAHKCGVYVVHVCKFQDKTNGVYIYCKYKYKENENKDVIGSPWLPNNMFKGMENDINYTLEELGITCPTQKDNYVRQ